MLHRWTRAALAVPLSLALAASAQAATVSVAGLRIDNRTDQPLGVDDTTPALSWKLDRHRRERASDRLRGRGDRRERRAAVGLREGDVERVAGDATRVQALTSRAKVSWRVRVWDGNGDASEWSAPVELRDGPAAARPTGARRSGSTCPPPPLNRPVVYDVGEQDGRYVRIDVTKLGLGALRELVQRHRVAHPARRAAGARAGRDEPRADQERLGLRPVLLAGLGHQAAHRRPDQRPGLHEPPADHAGRQPVQVGAGRPRLGPALQQGRPLSALRRAHAGRARSRTSRSTSRSARARRPRRRR